MKKRLLVGVSVLLTAALAFGAGYGTLAYYTKSFKSEGNSITTAKFNVNEVETKDGLFFGTNKFIVVGGNFAPGKIGQKEFAIAKTGTEVNVEYRIKVTTRPAVAESTKTDYLFRVNTPIKLNLLVKNDAGTFYTYREGIVSGEEIIIPAISDKMDFAVQYVWPWETANVDDKEFAGDTGIIDLDLEARQIKEGTTYYHTYLRSKREPGTTPGTFVTKSSSTMAKVSIDSQGKLLEASGYDSLFGSFLFDGTTFTTSKYPTGWNASNVKNVNGYYSFSQGGGTNASGELIVELQSDELK